MCCHPPRRRREFGGDPAAGYGEHTLVVVAHHDLSRGKAPRKCESGLARSRSQVEDNPRVSLLRSDRVHHRMPDRSKLWQCGLVEARQLLVKLGEHLAFWVLTITTLILPALKFVASIFIIRDMAYGKLGPFGTVCHNFMHVACSYHAAATKIARGRRRFVA